MNEPSDQRGRFERPAGAGTSLWMEIEPTLLGVRFLGAATRGVCAQVLGDDEAADLDLALVEAATNVVKHGFAGRADGRLRVQLIVTDAFVEIVLRDDGPEFDPLAGTGNAPWEGGGYGSFEDLPEGGFGLGLIRALVGDCTYSREAVDNVLVLRKRYR